MLALIAVVCIAAVTALGGRAKQFVQTLGSGGGDESRRQRVVLRMELEMYRQADETPAAAADRALQEATRILSEAGLNAALDIDDPQYGD
jgi:hypothetical protein